MTPFNAVESVVNSNVRTSEEMPQSRIIYRTPKRAEWGLDGSDRMISSVADGTYTTLHPNKCIGGTEPTILRIILRAAKTIATVSPIRVLIDL